VTATPLALNVFFTRQCNYACGFCFHTQTNVSRLPPSVWASAMPNFKRAGVSKVNFAGGEPFLFPEELGEMVRAARAAGLTTSVITNMSCANKVDAWFGEYGSSLSMLGVSFDSGSDFINHTHGRWPKGGGAPDPARRAAGGVSLAVKNLRIHAEACRKHSVPLKINTVVTARNADEDLFEVINEVKPVRWKVFQVLELEGENAGACALSNVAPLLISSEKFRAYCDRNQRGLAHELQGIMKREGNATMQNSYLLLDEGGRFLDCGGGGKVPTASIFDAEGACTAESVLREMRKVHFDEAEYLARDGDFHRTGELQF